MKIKSDELKNIMERLVAEIEIYLGDEIEIKDDNEYYWDIPESKIFNVDKEMDNNRGIGQISDDWDELTRLLNVDEEAISYDVKRLAIILLAIRNNSGGIW